MTYSSYEYTSPNRPLYKNYRFPAEIISHGVWLYYQFCLSYRDVEDVSCCMKASIHVTAEDISMEIRQILAPTDFSEYSKQAVAYAYGLAQTFGAKLVLLHVVEELPPYIGFIPQGQVTAVLKDLERQARFDLAQLLPEALDGKVEVMYQVVVGTPYLKIIEVAKEMKADLIVIATHGRTGFRHFVMGSVAERVVRTAPCGVLTIRPMAATDKDSTPPGPSLPV